MRRREKDVCIYACERKHLQALSEVFLCLKKKKKRITCFISEVSAIEGGYSTSSVDGEGKADGP